MSYSIGSVPYNFVRWEGPRPQFTKQHVQTFTKTGVAGVSQLALGVHGDPFEVTLTSVFDTEASARGGENLYRTLIGAGAQTLVYEGTNYTITYAHQYLVEDVVVEEAKRLPLITGPGYSYVGGWRVRSRWRLRAVALN